jgi:pyruvate,water dikinase
VAQRETDRWWRDNVWSTGSLSLERAQAQLREARRRFGLSVLLDGVHFMCAVQPVYDQMNKAAISAGLPDASSLMGGYGSHVESAVVDDLWKAGRGRLTVEDVVKRHGYHGPREGELSGVVWREDDRPVQRLIEHYMAMPDDADPAIQEQTRRQERLRLEGDLRRSLPRSRRAPIKLVLRMAASTIPMRGVAKSAFLQSFDMARASARRIGECLASDGVISERDDVFFLTADELGGDLSEAKAIVGERRELYDEYCALEIPEAWKGQPEPIRIATGSKHQPDDEDVLEGVAASPGVVEGPVRVVTDPAFTEVEPGEILVAATTDPSWAAIMFVSKALVVDIGGVLSHAAVVARELAIPCVVNTRKGTRVLRTGDYCRVDGTKGRVDIIRRAI